MCDHYFQDYYYYYWSIKMYIAGVIIRYDYMPYGVYVFLF